MILLYLLLLKAKQNNRAQAAEPDKLKQEEIFKKMDNFLNFSASEIIVSDGRRKFCFLNIAKDHSVVCLVP